MGDLACGKKERTGEKRKYDLSCREGAEGARQTKRSRSQKEDVRSLGPRGGKNNTKESGEERLNSRKKTGK